MAAAERSSAHGSTLAGTGASKAIGPKCSGATSRKPIEWWNANDASLRGRTFTSQQSTGYSPVNRSIATDAMSPLWYILCAGLSVLYTALGAALVSKPMPLTPPQLFPTDVHFALGRTHGLLIRVVGRKAPAFVTHSEGGADNVRLYVDGEAVPDRAWSRRQAASLVKLLALAPGQRLHREVVIDALERAVR